MHLSLWIKWNILNKIYTIILHVYLCTFRPNIKCPYITHKMLTKVFISLMLIYAWLLIRWLARSRAVGRTPRVALIKMTPLADRCINFRAFYHLSVELNKLINFLSCAWYALMWTVEWKIRQLQLPLGTHIDTPRYPYKYANYVSYTRRTLGFNKNVIIIHFEEFIDLTCWSNCLNCNLKGCTCSCDAW